MYVRCSIDVENPNEPRDFISGRIVEINDFSEVAKVEFFDLLNLRKYYNVPQTLEFPLSKLNHCILRNGSLAEYNGNMYHIIQHNIDKSNNFIYYYLTSDTSTVLKICEKDLAEVQSITLFILSITLSTDLRNLLVVRYF